MTSTARKVPICRVATGDAEKEAVCRVLDSGWLVQGQEVARFEQRVAAMSGVDHGVATTSCTTALHLALKALDVRPGDEVIVPGFTWVSTANAVQHCGATPVFCDVELDTWNMNPSLVESLITEKTVGIIPVHLFGLFADLPVIASIAQKHDLWVVEDAACALGSRLGRAECGQLSDAACFSFHPRKSITTGEGGMIVTSRRDLAERCRTLRNHGASVSDHQRHQSKAGFLLSEFNEFGFNYRMTDLQAAVGNAQLDRFDSILAERTRCAEYYDRALASFTWLVTPQRPQHAVHSWQSYVCLFAPETPTVHNRETLEERRNQLLMAMEEHGVTTRQGTHAPVRLGCYQTEYGLTEEQFPHSWQADGLSISLPLFPGLSEDDMDYVVATLHGCFAEQ